jgi:hypothetical protein
MSYDIRFRLWMLYLTKKFRCSLFLKIDSYPRGKQVHYILTHYTREGNRGFPSLSLCFEWSRHCVNRRVQYDKRQCEEGTEQSHRKCPSQQLVASEVSSHVLVICLPMQVRCIASASSYMEVDRDSPCAGEPLNSIL